MWRALNVAQALLLFIYLIFLTYHLAHAQEDVPSTLRKIKPLEEGLPDRWDKFAPGLYSAPSLLQPEDDLTKSDSTLASMIRVFVNKIRIIGNTSFSDDVVSKITSRYENREISFQELQDLRQELTLLYINKGYINSGVIIPEQKVIDGIIVLNVVEGTLSSIDIEGNKYFNPKFFRERLKLAAGSPLNIYGLEQELQNLQQDSRIKSINAELGPGVMQGDAVLKLHIEDEKPLKISLNLSNNQSPSVGSYKGDLLVAYQNLFGMGHILEGSYSLSEGNDDYSVRYMLPVTASDTTVAVFYNKSHSTVIEEAFKLIDITSETTTFGLTCSYPLYKSFNQELSLTLSGEVRRNETFLLGLPFSFTDEPDNVTYVSVVRFLQDWVKRSNTEVLSMRSNFSLGIDAFNATVSDSGVDGKFILWKGQLLWLRQITEGGIQAVFHTDVQLTNDSLLSMERFPIGGIYSVRGYRKNQLVRDSGVVSSIELRIPIVKNSQQLTIAQFAPFADFGWSWAARGATPKPKKISSIGAGIRWNIRENMHVSVYAGFPLREINNTEYDLQDDGIHFQFGWQIL